MREPTYSIELTKDEVEVMLLSKILANGVLITACDEHGAIDTAKLARYATLFESGACESYSIKLGKLVVGIHRETNK